MSIDQKKKKKKITNLPKNKNTTNKNISYLRIPYFFWRTSSNERCDDKCDNDFEKKKQMKIPSSSKKKNIYITTTNCYHYYLLLPTTYSNSFFFSVYMYLGAPRARFDVLHFDFGAFSTEFATDCQY